MLSQIKIFVLGTVLGTVLGAALFASIAHFLLIGLAVVGAGVLAHRGRRHLALRPGEAGKRLKA